MKKKDNFVTTYLEPLKEETFNVPPTCCNKLSYHHRHVCRLTVPKGNPKINNPQNCKVKLVYLLKQLKARAKLY